MRWGNTRSYPRSCVSRDMSERCKTRCAPKRLCVNTDSSVDEDSRQRPIASIPYKSMVETSFALSVSGFNYLGSENLLDNGAPTNVVDAARRHDIHYADSQDSYFNMIGDKKTVKLSKHSKCKHF